MTRFIEVTPSDSGIDRLWVNPDTVAAVAVVKDVTSITMVTGDIIPLQDEGLQVASWLCTPPEWGGR